MVKGTNTIWQNGLYIKMVLCLLCLLISVSSVFGQGWGVRYDNTSGTDLVRTIDGRYVIIGDTHSGTLYAQKVDLNGEVLASSVFNEVFTETFLAKQVIETADGGFAVLISNGGSVSLVKLNSQLGLEWLSEEFMSFTSAWVSGLHEEPNGDFILSGTRQSSLVGSKSEFFLSRVNSEGNFIWSQYFSPGEDDYRSQGFSALSDGNYIIVGSHLWTESVFEFSEGYFMKISPYGTLLNQGSFSDMVLMDVVAYPDGALAFAGYDINTNELKLKKLNPEGDVTVNKTYSDYFFSYNVMDLFPIRDGGLGLVGNVSNAELENNAGYFMKLDNDGEIDWGSYYGKELNTYGYAGLSTLSGGFVIIGDAYNDLNGWFDTYLVKIDGDEGAYSHILNGNVYHDSNDNCQKDVNENGIKEWVVEAVGNDTIHCITDEFGNYHLALDTGAYRIKATPANFLFELNCGIDDEIVIESLNDSSYHNIAAKEVSVCPVLEVDLSSSSLVRCETSRYQIDYCNKGVAQAEATYIEIDFDYDLEVLSSSLPWDAIDNQVYTFDIGALDVSQCGYFFVDVTVKCDSYLGKTHCVKAEISPELDCQDPDAEWDGSKVKVDGRCTDGFIQFQIVNEGDDDMQQALPFTVYEDDVILRLGNFQIPAGEDTTILLASTGRTYRLEASQSEGAAGESFPRAEVEACGGTFGGDVSLGFISTAIEDDLESFVSYDCQQNELSAEAVSVIASPKGVYEPHFIRKGDELEYVIRFENDGTDSTFLLVVRDTLPDHLDISRIELGASSHEYEFALRPNRVLEWTFKDIGLPPSMGASSSADNKGFVKFRIAQNPEILMGTVIRNSAMVWHNYDEPVLTNETYHTIAEEFYQFSLEPPINEPPAARVGVYPNPISSEAQVIIQGENYTGLQFVVFNPQGKRVRYVYLGSQSTFKFYREDLPTGVYLFEIRNYGELLNKGKLVIQ